MKSLPLALAALALLVPNALAVDRYAAPGGSTTDTTCPESTPCELKRAIETVAANGDTVKVKPGTYDVGGGITQSQFMFKTVNVEAQDLDDRPQVTLAGGTWNFVAGTLKGIRLTASPGLGAALTVRSFATASQMEIASTQEGVRFEDIGGKLTDSTVRSTGTALRAERFGQTTSIKLRNVTAIATGAGANGLLVRGSLFMGNANAFTVDAKNLIVRGGAGATDLFTDKNGAASATNATLDITHSNYETTGGDGTLNAGAGNQTSTAQTDESAIFAGFAAGDLRQKAGSPTVDAGTTDADNGTRDFQNEARVQGTATDIGADEGVVGVTPPAEVPASSAPAEAPAANTTAPGATPGPGAGTPAQPGAPSVSGSKFDVESGTVEIPLTCSAAAGCTGTAALQATATASMSKTVKLGSKSFSLKAGGRTTLRIKLNATGKKLLKGRKKLKVKLVITVGGKSTTKTVTLKPSAV